MGPTRVLTAAMIATCAITLSACDLRDLGVDRTHPHQAAVHPTAAAATPAAAPNSGGAEIGLLPLPVLSTRHSEFGTLVVNAHGRTLYRSNADTSNPSRSHCTGQCLTVWHKALVRGTHVRVRGVDARLVSTIAAGHGLRQLTLAGWPLYTFTGDKKAGQVTGQCGGVFFAVTPVGTPNTM